MTIDILLAERAKAMAEHDGGSVGAAHFHGAATQLHQELLHARDQLILALQPKPAPTVVADDAPPETVAAAPHPSRSSGAKRGGAKKTPS